MNKKIAVVTGANKGIGFEICRQLAKSKKDSFHVILTARDVARGEAAARKLQDEGLDVRCHQLDVTNETSVNHLKHFLTHHHDRLDVLINNAGVFIETSASGPVSAVEANIDIVKKTLETNLYGPIRVCQALLPLLKKSGAGRIINLSSGLGQLSEMEGGYPGYRISKAGLNAVTRMLANELAEFKIAVNSVCPGWVKTDMGGPNAERSIEQGADTPVWLATEAEASKTGLFFRDRKPIPW
jgi:NAD(P)-dependent dehydrogenase (short-subunit alcohol dehydrogenase family)